VCPAHRKRGQGGLPRGLVRNKAKGKTYWRFLYTDHHGDRQSVQIGAVSKREAVTTAHQLLAELSEKGRLHPSDAPASVGWSEFVDGYYLAYLEEQKAPATIASERASLGWLGEYFLAMPITAITTGDVEDYKRWRRVHRGAHGKGKARRVPKGQTSARTINLNLQAFRNVMNYARQLGKLEQVPEVIRLPEKAERRPRKYIEANQFETVIDAAGPKRRLLVMFALYTGMRPGEIASRTLADLEFDRGLIRVDDHPEQGFMVKAGQRRLVPMLPKLQEELEAARDEFPTSGPIFEGQSLKMTLRRASKAAGLDFVLSPHGCRHSFATRAASDRWPIRLLQDWLGHSDLRMISEVYVHLDEKPLQDQAVRTRWGEDAKVIDLHKKDG